MIKIDEYLELKDNDTIVVACSTGPDSMALVDMLLKVKDKYNLNLIIAHVNHNVRAQSIEEQKYIEEYCSLNKLIFETMKIEKYSNDNFENEARKIRYEFFDNVVKKYSANYLMTAHHGDDLIETIMMRIVRGSNLNGYSGFKEVVEKDGYKLVRPLIRFTKKELEDYCEENKVKYYVDISNSDQKYTRNRYRKNILPFLKSEDENVHSKFLKFSLTLDEVNHYIDKERKASINRCVINNKILIKEFIKEDIFMQKEILYSLLNQFYQDDLMLLTDKHIELLMDTINSNKSNCFVNLPNDVIAKKAYDTLELVNETVLVTDYEFEIDKFVKLPNKHTIECVEEVDGNSNDICRLNSEEITLPLIVRNKRIGDKIKVKGLFGTKKVKDIFIDKKIPMDERELWPVVIDANGKVVWIPGIKKSIFDKNKSDSHDIVLKYK